MVPYTRFRIKDKRHQVYYLLKVMVGKRKIKY